MTGPRIPRLPEQPAHGSCRLVSSRPPGIEPDRPWPRQPASDANTGTLDPNTMRLVRGAVRLGELATECEHFREGYVSGQRAGVLQGILVGLVLGVSLVAAALQAGFWIGGMP